MQDYYDCLRTARYLGTGADDRTGVGTVSSFGAQMHFDLRKGFPLLTGKFTPFKSIVHELLWFLQGDTNLAYLRKNGVSIWDEWADEDGDLGPIYGYQWRSWPAGVLKYDTAIGEFEETVFVDQIKNLIKGLKNNPFSRRHIVSAWNVADLPDEAISPQLNVSLGKMALAPCHCLFQFHVRKLTPQERANMVGSWGVAIVDANILPQYGLSCQLYQRSADMFLGVPFNIASYALLTHMIAHVCNMVPERFIHTLGDYHVYRNHFNQVDELLSRDPDKYPLPTLKINRKIDSIDDFKLDDFEIVSYQSYPAIKAPVAI